MTLSKVNMKPIASKEATISNVSQKSRKRKNEECVDESITKKLKTISLSRPSIKGGVVLTAGTGDIGQLGLGPDIEEKIRPAAVKEIPSISLVCAGGLHSVCLTEDGKVYTWGCNDEGGLGRQTEDEEDNFTPGVVEIEGEVVKISAGDCHSVALTSDGRVFGWGSFRDNSGPLGFLSKAVIEKVPVQILKGINIKSIASGNNHVVCLSQDGVVYTFGCGESGQLGRIAEVFASRDSRHRNVIEKLLTPSQIKVYKSRKMIKFDEVWAGGFVTFVRALSGDIYGFGLNNYCQLGDEDTNMKFQPFLLKQFKNKKWSKISPGQHHSVALTDDGEVYVMGRHEYGRLGLFKEPEDPKSGRDAEVPTIIPSLKDKKALHVAAGECVSFVVLDNGEAYGFGMGTNNQLCSGDDEDRWEPSLLGGKQLVDKKVVMAEPGGQHTILLAVPKES